MPNTPRPLEKELPIRKAALVAGLSILVMVLTTPLAEFAIFPKLIVNGNAAKTAENIIANKQLFTIAIFLILLTLIADIIAAWALYIFLKPVHKSLSLLTAWFRLMYTGMYFIAVYNLLGILSVINATADIQDTSLEQLHDQILLHFNTFRIESAFGLVVFGVYLILLGYLVYKATYVPRIFGLILAIAGLSWVIDNLSVFLFPELPTGFLFALTTGELIFMFWLLIKGSRIQQEQVYVTN